MIANNFYWGIWALTILNPNDVTNETVFNYEYANIRTRLHKHLVALWGSELELDTLKPK
jgi:hypothetical protein